MIEWMNRYGVIYHSIFQTFTRFLPLVTALVIAKYLRA